MLVIIGYIAAIIVGLTLGLIGGGGSILTVPILVYLFKIPPVMATTYSLFIVGLTSSFAAWGYIKNKLVNFKVGISFSIPSVIGVLSSRKFIVPAIPKELLNIGNYTLTKDTGILFLFAIMMVAASISMIKKKKVEAIAEKTTTEFQKLLSISIKMLIIGILIGLIGAGGGFLLIPALVMFASMEMKEAVATSLLVITINSGIGFIGDLTNNNTIDWLFLGSFSIFTIMGAFIGTYFSKFVSSEKLKPAFGWFVLVMGIFIILKEGLSTH